MKKHRKERDKKPPNRLVSEKSSYLLQHAYNPVDWYPWAEDAFEKARKEDKPIFLSIGYSTCHWCHVMAHESFEDDETAVLMNEHFVNIKVDREERPDLDSIYMSACQIMTGSGGWPLTIIMTPDKKPFFAATYIPRESIGGRIGMLDLLSSVKNLWANQKQKAVATAETLTGHLKRISATTANGDLGRDVGEIAYKELSNLFDDAHGGFGTAPKFPAPHNLLFLLRYWKKMGKERGLSMVEKTLLEMKLGGIFDHVGSGFHRYSTDKRWLLPHFEKMLYDQSMLLVAYAEAYQATKKEEYKETFESITTYVLRNLSSPEGGFYSADDADSEGVEGKFYLWSEDEIRDALSNESAELVIKVFNIEKDGNFLEEATRERTGKNILHLAKPLSLISGELEIPLEDLKSRLEVAMKRLFFVREKRVRPSRDEKILTDWNGLMIAALAIGARVFNEERYTKMAREAADFVLSKMVNPAGRLLHRYNGGEAGIKGFLDDHAFFVWGLIELYETTFDVFYLGKAVALTDGMVEHFWDKERRGFYMTPDDGEELLVRKKEVYDGAYPSGNSVALLNLLRLARITGNADLQEKAEDMAEVFSKKIVQSPASHTHFISAVEFLHGPSQEVVIVGNIKSADTKAMIEGIWGEFVPNKVVLFRPSNEKQPKITQISEFTKGYTEKDGKATAYVCSNYSCKNPTTNPVEMLRLLRSG